MTNTDQHIKQLEQNPKFQGWYKKRFIPYADNQPKAKTLTEMVLDIESMIDDYTVSGTPILYKMISNHKTH